jgi:outer membrane protein TolC
MNIPDMNKAAPPRGRRRCLAAALALLLLFPACAHREARYTPESVAPPPTMEAAKIRLETTLPERAAASAGVTAPDPAPVNITLADAIQTALTRNRSLAVQSYSPSIARKSIDEARAAFDPGLTANMNYRNQNLPGVTTTASDTTTAATGQSGTAETTDSLTQALTVFQTLLKETQKIERVLEAGNTTVTHTNTLGSDATLSQPLPSGTQVYVTGDYGRNDSSLLADGIYSGDWSVGVSQALLRGFGSDVNLVSLRTARNNAAISDYALRDFTLQLVAQVETAYWGLAMAQETLRIQEFALGLAQEQLDLNQAMISVGKLSGSARFSAESEVASKKADLVNAQAALINRAINLWQLLNPDTQTPESLQFLPITLPEVRDPVPTPAECVALADLFRPDLAQARLDLANGQLAVVQTKNGLLPQLDAFVSYGANSSGAGSGSWSRYLDDMTYDRFEAGLSFTLTLGNRAEKARYQRAKLQLDQAGASIRNLQQNIEAELRKAIAESAREVEQVAASHQEVINREQELAVETEQFRLGRSTNLNVLQVQQKLVQAKMQEAAARVGRLQAVTSLYQKEGTLLTRRGIVLDKDREPLS